ncbi:MAG TPA: glutamate--tRNA ligase [Chthonomonadales bacterium]|nr:glutamate--tRNA ligase [Chthonomonadales bacterium]
MSVRVRFAPSPTGSPHVGNIRTAIYNWLFARKTGGQFIARLEDTDRDPERYRPESIREIEESLRFLGIEPDEWWVTGGPAGPYVQSERLELYRKAADELIAAGKAYRCYCTPERLAELRSRQQQQGIPSGYDRRCRYLTEEDRARYEAEGAPYTVRLAVPREGKTTYRDVVYGEISVENKLIDDQVLLKSNGWPTYHLGVVVDDHAMGITHVIRGEDWQPSTPKHILLYQALGWEQPVWVHVPLILGTDRKKLSKRHGTTQFTDFIREGYLPEAMFNFLVLLGWSAGEENRELFTVAEILERFSLDGITRHPAVFDYDKLRWMNGEYIRSSRPERIVKLCLPYLVQAGLIDDPPSEEQQVYAAAVIPLVIDRLHVLSDVVELTEFFFREPQEPEEKGRKKWLSGPEAEERLDRSLEAFAHLKGPLTVETAEETVNSIAEEMQSERAPIIHTLRVATTGRTVGPGLFELLSVLGKERVLARLHRAKAWLIS